MPPRLSPKRPVRGAAQVLAEDVGPATAGAAESCAKDLTSALVDLHDHGLGLGHELATEVAAFPTHAGVAESAER